MGFISARKWLRLIFNLYISRPTSRVGCFKISAVVNSDYSILNAVCEKNPPLYIIKFLCRKYPQAVFEKDNNGCFPLHSACKFGCRPDVIEYLLRRNSRVAAKSDEKGRIPLLLAYRCYAHNRKKGWISANQDLLKVISILSDFDSISFSNRLWREIFVYRFFHSHEVITRSLSEMKLWIFSFP